MDYGPLDVVLIFEACETRKCVNVSILDDFVEEPEEFFTYHLMRTPYLNPRIQLEPATGKIVIVSLDCE